MVKLKNIKKRTVIIAAIALVLAGTTFALFSPFRGGKDTVVTGYSALSATELVNSVSASGNVESSMSRNIYSSLNYPVKKIHVKVGDHVSAGDLLAELDTEALKLDVAQQRSILSNSQKTAAIDLEDKRLNFNNSKNQYENGNNPELVNAGYALQTAQSDLNTKKTDYESNKLLFESGAVSRQALNESETAYKLASAAYDKALSSLNSTKTKIKQDLKASEAGLKTAEANVGNDSQLIALQKLEKNLADTAIKAPIEGTITAIYAKEGSPGNGLLFIVEDTANLIVTAYVKEYDAVKVHEGQTVTVKSDSIGNKTVNGKVIMIDPASTKDGSGVTETASAVEFKTKIAVLDRDTQLKIGMNVRLNIILEKKPHVFAVPSDAVTVNSEGKDIVYAITDTKGKKRIKELEVKKGMETDLYTEVSGESIAEGVIVVNDAAGVKPGSIVTLQQAEQ